MLEVADAGATGNVYHRNHSDAEGVLAAARRNQAPGSPVGYVGEWHSHPLPVHASATDKRELDRIGARAKGPVVLIVLVRHPDEWRAEVWVSNGRQQKSVEFVVY
jgi:proteasome lid subunit RPN8/RPN11